MSIAVELPALGESVVEGTITRWLVGEGDFVELDQPLVEITTDKVDAEIPAPAAGVIEKILVAEGETVDVGAQLAILDDRASVSAESVGQAVQSVRGEASPAPASGPAGAELAVSAAKATPLARRLAEEAEFDLGGIHGSGSAGRITKSDVLRHVAAPPQTGPTAAPMPQPNEPNQRARPAASGRAAPFAYSLQEGDRVVPMTPQRRLIAEHMVFSKHTSPHVGTVAEVDMSGVVRVRNQHKAAFQKVHGLPLTFLPFIVSATVRALREFPRLNASVLDQAIVEKAHIHIGVAVETEKGLVVPVVRHADRLSLAGQVAAIEDLSVRARTKKLSADELRGGTFTISNPGRQGNLYGFAIINQPQVGILRMGEIVKRPVVKTVEGEDLIAIRPIMHLALSYDHRAVDGAPANGFLHRIRELLETADFDL